MVVETVLEMVLQTTIKISTGKIIVTTTMLLGMVVEESLNIVGVSTKESNVNLGKTADLLKGVVIVTTAHMV